MKAIFLFVLACIAVPAQAECLEFYFDKDGNQHSTPCNTKSAEVKCAWQSAYWNGRSCVKLPQLEQVQRCQSQGGEWDPSTIKTKPICICPQQQVWDGKNCRSDIPPSQQCVFEHGLIRVTKNLVASAKIKCEEVRPEHTCRGAQGSWVADAPNGKPFCFCPDKLVWDGKNCRSDIPLSKQCGIEGGMVRVTKEFVGSKNCEPVLQLKRRG